ncbi:hypothetical protein E2320_021738, partial [Naja naja]
TPRRCTLPGVTAAQGPDHWQLLAKVERVYHQLAGGRKVRLPALTSRRRNLIHCQLNHPLKKPIQNHMRIENHKQTPPLECFPQSPLELTGTDHDKDKQKTGLIQNFFGLFDRASQYLIACKKNPTNDLDSSNDEETLGNLAEIEVLLKVLHEKVFNIIQSSVIIASKEPELLNNAVKAVIMWVEEEEKERSIHSHSKHGKRNGGLSRNL